MTTAPQTPQCGGKLYGTVDGVVHMSILPNQREPWPACRVSDESLADMQVMDTAAADAPLSCPECLRWRAADETIAYRMLVAETHRDGQLDDGRPSPVHDAVAAEVLTVPTGLLDMRDVNLPDEELATLKQRFIDSVSGVSRWFDAVNGAPLPVVTSESIPDDGTAPIGPVDKETLRVLRAAGGEMAELSRRAADAFGPRPSVLDATAESLLSDDQRTGLNAIRDYENCDRCNYDTHRCPGCGEPLVHGVESCNDCSDRIRLKARCHVHTPKQCVLNEGHAGVHESNSGTTWLDPSLPKEEQRRQSFIGPCGHDDCLAEMNGLAAELGLNWCHVHNRVAESGREECAECDGERGEDRKAGE